jgi:hypothetical protein
MLESRCQVLRRIEESREHFISSKLAAEAVAVAHIHGAHAVVV